MAGVSDNEKMCRDNHMSERPVLSSIRKAAQTSGGFQRNCQDPRPYPFRRVVGVSKPST